MTVTTHTTNRQVVHASTLAELIAAPGFHTGMMATVGDNGAGDPACYGVYPTGTLPVSSPHVVNSTATAVQFIDEFARLNGGLAPLAHAASHYPGGSDAINLSNATTAGFSPAQGTTANRFLGTNGAGVASYTTVPWGSLSSVPSSFSPSAHASRHVSSGTDPIPVAASGVTGLMPAPPATGLALPTSVDGSVSWASGISAAFILGGGTGNRVVLTTDGTSCSLGLIVDAMVSNSANITWSKIAHPTTFTPSAHASDHVTGGADPISGLGWGQLTGYPTVTATAPLRIDGGASANISASRTLSITAASGSAAGSMSPAHYTKVNGLPTATTGFNGYLLTPSATNDNFYVLSTTSDLGLVTGSGTASYLPRFTGARTLANSSVSDDGTVVTLNTLRATGPIGAAGEVQSTSTNSFRIVSANYGAFWRNDDSDVYLLLTNSGDRYGAFNALRPLRVSLATGDVSLNNGGAYFRASDGATGFGTTSPTATVDINGTLRVRGGSPGVGKLMQSDADGDGVWSSELSNLTSITFVSTVSPAINQASTSDAVARSLYIDGQESTAGSGVGGPVVIRGGAGAGATNGNVASGDAGTVRILADAAVGSASFGKDMVDIETPLLVHGSAVFAANIESHVLSREAGFALFEDVRWFRHSQAATTPINFDVPTGMDGTWMIDFTIYIQGINLFDIRGGAWVRSGGTLTAGTQFDVSNASGLGYPLTASGDNARITINPPNATSRVWLVKAHIVRFL